MAAVQSDVVCYLLHVPPRLPGGGYVIVGLLADEAGGKAGSAYAQCCGLFCGEECLPGACGAECVFCFPEQLLVGADDGVFWHTVMKFEAASLREK